MSLELLLFINKMLVFVVGFCLVVLAMFIIVWISSKLIIKEYFKKLEDVLHDKKTNGKGKKGTTTKKNPK